jgi:hypothetical protein
MLYEDCNHNCSVEKENNGRESQRASRQNELIGGKLPVVK